MWVEDDTFDLGVVDLGPRAHEVPERRPGRGVDGVGQPHAQHDVEGVRGIGLDLGLALE